MVRINNKNYSDFVTFNVPNLRKKAKVECHNIKENMDNKLTYKKLAHRQKNRIKH